MLQSTIGRQCSHINSHVPHEMLVNSGQHFQICGKDKTAFLQPIFFTPGMTKHLGLEATYLETQKSFGMLGERGSAHLYVDHWLNIKEKINMTMPLTTIPKRLRLHIN